MENQEKINQVVNDESNLNVVESANDTQISSKGVSHNYFFIAIVVIVAVLVALAIYIYIGSVEQEINEVNDSVVILEEQAYIKLNPDKEIYYIGEDVVLDIRLATNERTSGADVILEFDPKYLELLERPEKNIGGNPSLRHLADVSAAVYANVPYARLEQVGDKMVFSFSAITSALETFKGGGSIAILKFETLKAGKTTIHIVSDNSLPIDSNVAFDGRDILTEVTDATITIVD